jgi:hypothetical protein
MFSAAFGDRRCETICIRLVEYTVWRIPVQTHLGSVVRLKSYMYIDLASGGNRH